MALRVLRELRALAEAILSSKLYFHRVRLSINEEVETPSDLPISFLDRPEDKVSFVGIDAASITLHTLYGEVAIASGAIGTKANASYYPTFLGYSRGDSLPYVGALESGGLNWVTDEYVLLKKPYRLDPFLPEGAISHDIRINLESNLILKAGKLFNKSVLLIDGPATYPFSPITEGSEWSVELGLLNNLRVKAMMKAFNSGLIPLCVVKRVWRSIYIPEAISSERKDIAVIMNYVNKHFPLSKPLIIGPWESRGRAGVPDRVMAYLVIPLNNYLNITSILRVEMLRDIAETLGKDFLNLSKALSWEIVEYGTYIPPEIQVVDKLSKALVRRYASLIEAVFNRMGILILYSGEGVE